LEVWTGLALLAIVAILSSTPFGRESRADDEIPLSIDAGEDQTVQTESPAILDGRGSTLSPLAFLIGDGNGPLEDRLMEYDSRTGVSSRTLRDPLNQPFGWPGDMIRVEGALIGADVGSGRLVLVEKNSGSFRYLTKRITRGELAGLAFDQSNKRLLAAASGKQELLAVDLDNCTSELIRSLAPLTEIRGLAWSAEFQRALVYDQKTRGLYLVDPDSEDMELLVTLPIPTDKICDEIEMFEGRLYCTLAGGIGGLGEVQLCQIDMSSGALTKLGPPVPKTVGHMLVMLSVPEPTRWSQISGPENAAISSPRSLFTSVTFQEPGEYVFELSVNDNRELSDRVTLTVSREDDR
jgi:hypothetical protein